MTLPCTQDSSAPFETPAPFAFTVFTAAFNRAHTLPRVYDSLRAQTLRDFEWLIVDDGSTDGTVALVQQWQAEADFPIRYQWQENAGYNLALNAGAQAARGELFVYADSDDAFVPDALERIRAHWRGIPETERDGFAGVCCRCVDEHGRFIGTPFPQDPLDATMLDVHYRHKTRGEAWVVNRTDVMRRFPFPEDARGFYIGTTYVWHRIARFYKMRFINDALRIYYQGAPDQITSLHLTKRTAARAFRADPLNHELDWFRHAPAEFLIDAVKYACLCFAAGDTLAVQRGRLTHPGARALWLLSLVPGWVLARRMMRGGKA